MPPTSLRAAVAASITHSCELPPCAMASERSGASATSVLSEEEKEVDEEVVDEDKDAPKPTSQPRGSGAAVRTSI